MYGPVFTYRLTQVLHAERLDEAAQAHRHQQHRHQLVYGAQLIRRAGILTGDLLIAAGQRLKTQGDRPLMQRT